MSSIAGPSKRLLARCSVRLRPQTRRALPTGRKIFLPEQPQRRFASASAAGPDEKGYRVSYLFGGLVGFGMLVTIYGLLEYYYSLQTWPEPVRTPLKAALKAKNRGEYDRAEAYFRKAIEAALSVPSSVLDPDPLLKLSGIYISLATMLESQGQVVRAYSDLRDALSLFGSSPLKPGVVSGEWAGGAKLSEQDHLRAIGLHQKLGQMAVQIGSMRVPSPYPTVSDRTSPQTWDAAAEHYLSDALTAMLRLGLSSRSTAAANTPVVAGKDIQLPEGRADDAGGRVDKRGLGMTMESLAEVYARKGRYDLAGQLLIQAVSVLLPPKSDAAPSSSDICQAALLMTTISSHALQPPSERAIKASRSWSVRSLELAEQALNDNKSDQATAICARAKNIGSYNLGMLAEMEGDANTAMKHFERVRREAKEIGFSEGRRQAQEAIRRLQAASKTA